MATVRLTRRVIDALEPKASEFTIWDSDAPGFGVRVRPSGAAGGACRHLCPACRRGGQLHHRPRLWRGGRQRPAVRGLTRSGPVCRRRESLRISCQGAAYPMMSSPDRRRVGGAVLALAKSAVRSKQRSHPTRRPRLRIEVAAVMHRMVMGSLRPARFGAVHPARAGLRRWGDPGRISAPAL